MGLEAATKALLDAGVTYDSVQVAHVGYCYGDSTTGQRALYNLGLTGIPIINVNNNCSTGSTAFYQSNNLVKYGAAECALALGFERMAPGSLGTRFPDRPSPLRPHNDLREEVENAGLGTNKGPGAARFFGDAGAEYIKQYGGTVEHFARIASKNHKHSLNNPYSQFRDGWNTEQVMASSGITNELTKFMCSPTSDGAACCIIASEDFVHQHELENQAIEVVGNALVTDGVETFEARTALELVGFSMTRRCADEVFSQAGFPKGEGRDKVAVIELHDCFASNELITYDALRLCSPGGAARLVEGGDNTYGGKYVVNPSGGLEAKGHPLGATGLGMHFYITMQLRGWAGPMQTPAATGKLGLVHNIGLGGAVVCSLLRRPQFYKPGGKNGIDRVGYNHGHICRPVTMSDVNKVRSIHSSNFVLERAKL